ncbi:MAG: hypothetical protein J4F33_08845 [Alphaproteobacteria bacterium]|nr:hypothetical protein [Alphaproteobacteria bacterium]
MSDLHSVSGESAPGPSAAAGMADDRDRVDAFLDATGDRAWREDEDDSDDGRAAPAGEAPGDATDAASPEGDSGAAGQREEAAAADADGDTDEGDAEPAIAPPTHWPAADKEAWEALPAAARALVSRNEQRAEARVAQRLKEAAEDRKALAAERSAMTQERQTSAARAAELVAALTRQIEGEFADVDWQKLAGEEPTEYIAKRAAYDARMGEVARARDEVAKAERAQAAEADARFREYAHRQEQALADAMPDWYEGAAPSAAGREAVGNVRRYLVEVEGFTADEVAQLVDHRTLLVAHKAYRYDRLRKAKPTRKKARPAPAKVQRPGDRNDSGDGGAAGAGGAERERTRRMDAKRKTLRDTGSPQAAEAVFAELIDQE